MVALELHRRCQGIWARRRTLPVPGLERSFCIISSYLCIYYHQKFASLLSHGMQAVLMSSSLPPLVEAGKGSLYCPRLACSKQVVGIGVSEANSRYPNEMVRMGEFMADQVLKPVPFYLPPSIRFKLVSCL